VRDRNNGAQRKSKQSNENNKLSGERQDGGKYVGYGGKTVERCDSTTQGAKVLGRIENEKHRRG
jgi:hypothetical protein